MPFNNLQREPKLKAYADRSVIESPENMPWDCSLNHEINFSADLHVTMINHMVKAEDGRFPEGKFYLSTTNNGAHAYYRILHPETGGAPLSNHIIQDVEKVFESMKMVQKYYGIKIDGLGNWKGKRQEAPCQDTRVGKRSRKNEQTKTCLHPDALLQRKVKTERAKIKYERQEDY